MKKFTLVLLVLVLALSCVFASGSAEETKTLTVWSGYPETEKLYQKVAAEFEAKHPGVNVEIVTYSLREFEQKLNAAIPAHACADVFDMSISITQPFIEAGLISANPDKVNQFVKESGRFTDLALDQIKYGDKTYGVPFFRGMKAMYYNKAAFAEAGLTTPPKTMKEYYEYGKKLAKYDANGNLTRSGIGLRIAGQGSGTAEKFLMMLWPMGGDIVVEGKTPGTYHDGYNNEAGYKTLKFYIDALYVDHIHDHSLKQDTEGFENGYAAMYLRESDVIADIASKVPDLQYGTAPIPADVRWGTMQTVEYLFVSDDAKDKDLAWEFVLEAMNADNQNYLLENVGWMPARIDVDYSAVIAKTPALEGFVVSDPEYGGFAAPAITCFDEIETKLAERIIAAFLDKSLANNEAGMKKVLADAAEETNAILKRTGYYGD